MLEIREFELWRPALEELVAGIREQVTGALQAADDNQEAKRALANPVGEGSGDITFGLDVPAEEFIDRWLRAQAAQRALSLLTEDRGWRHMGPDPEQAGGVIELPDFDHGGARIAIDPVDGTRNLMAGLRSAWSVISFAGAGAGMPSMADQSAGIVSELPTLRAARMSTFIGFGDTCERSERELPSGKLLLKSKVRVDADDRVDQGYFPFFRYDPKWRPHLAQLEADFFARLEKYEGADLRSIYDDQYISNAGQLVLLLSGTYRLIIDARALVARRVGQSTITSKPYDVAGAITCARAAGALITAANGDALDFPIDTKTAVDMAGYVNGATRARLEAHWLAVLEQRT